GSKPGEGNHRLSGTAQCVTTARPQALSHTDASGRSKMRGMKNFVRALRGAWPYRGRFLLSVACAGMAAVFWGVNISAIGPVLKLLGEKQNLQQWAEANIKDTQNEIDQWEEKRTDLVKREKEAHAQSPSPARSKELTQLASDIARLDRRQWQADW